jgi:hypothetical protein
MIINFCSELQNLHVKVLLNNDDVSKYTNEENELVIQLQFQDWNTASFSSKSDEVKLLNELLLLEITAEI